MISFNHSCPGYSHIKSGKECQDFSYSEIDVLHQLSIAVVSDGHGGESYFRSSVGSRLATDITVRLVKEFVTGVDKLTPHPFIGLPFTAVGISSSFEHSSHLDQLMRHMFTSIYTQWKSAILQHATQTPVTALERERVKGQYLAMLQSQNPSLENDVVTIYGCTLMCYVQTSKYWFAFHIGDGKLVCLNKEHAFLQPVPWDEKCFLNRTTSLCDPDAVSLFRYCVQGDGTFPTATFLGSDGVDGTYLKEEDLYNFYATILQGIKSKGLDVVKQSIIKELPAISQQGSHDDMSVAFIYDETLLAQAVEKMETFQKELLDKRIQEQQTVLIAKKEKLASLATKVDPHLAQITQKRELLQELKKKCEEVQAELEQLEGNKEMSRLQAEYRMTEKEIHKAESILDTLTTLKEQKCQEKNIFQKGVAFITNFFN